MIRQIIVEKSFRRSFSDVCVEHNQMQLSQQKQRPTAIGSALPITVVDTPDWKTAADATAPPNMTRPSIPLATLTFLKMDNNFRSDVLMIESLNMFFTLIVSFIKNHKETSGAIQMAAFNIYMYCLSAGATTASYMLRLRAAQMHSPLPHLNRCVCLWDQSL